MKKKQYRCLYRCLGQGLETLEKRDLLTSVPFGASTQDTAEYLLGDVNVSVVFLESNGMIDPDTEQWTSELANGVKANIEEGLQWWVDTLALSTDVHELNFKIDYTLADDPVEIPYEPISRPSQDFQLWMEDFFRAVNVPSQPGFSDEIYQFNHSQRLQNNANWSFTIFVVNTENDPNDLFGDENGANTDFRRAFSWPGGQFIVLPHNRPASTVAHELGHIFWAFDEYSSGDNYTSRRGYYSTQNTNGRNGNPNPGDIEPSIMNSTGSPFVNHQISQSARESVGWRDRDGDGIFDVLDTTHSIAGTTTFDAVNRTLAFLGSSTVRPLKNINPAGTQHDITLNRVTGLQYRFNGIDWQDLASYDDYVVSFDVTTPEIPSHVGKVEFRTIDHRIGVTSPTFEVEIESTRIVFQNPNNQHDVDGDTHVSPRDVLMLIQAINSGVIEPILAGPPFLDPSGDGTTSARDVLMVITFINDAIKARQDGAAEPPPQDSPSADAIAAFFSTANDDEDAADFWDAPLLAS